MLETNSFHVVVYGMRLTVSIFKRSGKTRLEIPSQSLHLATKTLGTVKMSFRWKDGNASPISISQGNTEQAPFCLLRKYTGLMFKYIYGVGRKVKSFVFASVCVRRKQLKHALLWERKNKKNKMWRWKKHCR